MTIFRFVSLITFMVAISEARKPFKRPGGGKPGKGRSINRNPAGAGGGAGACGAPTLPFETATSSGSSVEAEVSKITDCWYNYWKENNGYNGAKGFVSHFGTAGNIFDASTQFSQDGSVAHGHAKFTQKAVVTQNLVEFASEPYDVEITGNTADSVTFEWTVDIKTKVGPSQGSVQAVTSTDRLTFAANGVLISQVAVSANGVRGGLLNGVVGATVSASAALGLFDDETDNILTRNVENPIKFVFLSLLSLVTICGALCVWLLYKACYSPYGGKSVRYSKVAVSSGIDSNDDVYPLKA